MNLFYVELGHTIARISSGFSDRQNRFWWLGSEFF